MSETADLVKDLHRSGHHHSEGSARHKESSRRGDRKESSSNRSHRHHRHHHSYHKRSDHSYSHRSRHFDDQSKSDRDRKRRHSKERNETSAADEINDEFPGYTVIEAPAISDDEEDNDFAYQEGVIRKRFQDGQFESSIMDSFASFDQVRNSQHQSQEVKRGRFESSMREETTDVKQEYSAPSAKSVLDVSYTFGDRGSNWRMLKLNKCFETAREDNLRVEDVALRRYGSLALFYIAIEEREELNRRSKKKIPENEWILKPTGVLAKEKGLLTDDDVATSNASSTAEFSENKGEENSASDTRDVVVSQKQVNDAKLEALRAKLQKKSNYKEIQTEYERLLNLLNEQEKAEKSNNKPSTAFASIKNISFDPESMSIDDMIKEESLTSSKQALKQSAKMIASDVKFDDKDLDQQDENASKLADLTRKGKVNLSDISVNGNSIKRMTKALDTCIFCLDNETRQLPIISMANTCYLTVAPQPELTKYGCVIVPLSHEKNTLSLESDDNEEIRNYMKTITRFYFSELKMNVLFYESSVDETNHACIKALPIPMKFTASDIKGYFKQGILELINPDESHHTPVIDTLAKSDSLGRSAISSMISKEAPYFHVWLNMNGGIGHIVEDLKSWPKGDGFARGIIGGMLGMDSIESRQKTKFPYNDQEVVSKFRSLYKKYDWVSTT